MLTSPESGPWALSISKWCEARGISRSHYYVMQRQGLTPREIRIGGRVIITETADAEWQRKMMSADENGSS